MSDLLEDFESEDHSDPIAQVMAEAEAVEFRGIPVKMTDAAMVGAQSIGLRLFNLDEEKLLDSENVYPGQMADAVVTIFFCMCATSAGLELPGDTPNRAKWAKILKPRTIGAASMRPRMFEQVLVEFSDDFEVGTDIADTFDTFNRLWEHVFKTDIELKEEGGDTSPGKSPSPQQSGQPSPATSSGLTTTQPEMDYRQPPLTSQLQSI